MIILFVCEIGVHYKQRVVLGFHVVVHTVTSCLALQTRFGDGDQNVVLICQSVKHL